MTPMKKPAVKALFALVVATLLASSIGQRYLGHVMDAPDLDFYVYYLTAQVVHGQDGMGESYKEWLDANSSTGARTRRVAKKPLTGNILRRFAGACLRRACQ